MGRPISWIPARHASEFSFDLNGRGDKSLNPRKLSPPRKMWTGVNQFRAVAILKKLQLRWKLEFGVVWVKGHREGSAYVFLADLSTHDDKGKGSECKKYKEQEWQFTCVELGSQSMIDNGC